MRSPSRTRSLKEVPRSRACQVQGNLVARGIGSLPVSPYSIPEDL